MDVHVDWRWSNDAITNILDLYEADWMHRNMGLLAVCHWTRLQIKHTRQMHVKFRRVNTHI